MRKFSKLPKNAEPVDKLSFVGLSLFSGAIPSFKFVYKHNKRFYVIQCFGGFDAPIQRVITTKNLLINEKRIVSHD